MAEDTSTTTETTTTTTDQPDDLAGLRSALDKERSARRDAEKTARENADAAKRLALFEDAQKSETQKLAERAERAERDTRAAQVGMLRYKVAAAKGLTGDAVEFLSGGSEEELAANADRLLALVGGSSAAPPSPSLSGGPRPPAPALDMNTLIRQQAGRRS